MTKARYQKAINPSPTKLAILNGEKISGTLEGLLDSRRQKNLALMNLIQSCKNDDDIKRIENLGLLKFENASF